jgi:nitrite reductase/ring-hydroxylating ferredoxin subunit
MISPATCLMTDPGRGGVTLPIDQERYSPLPASSLPHVGTYRRRMAVSLERMFENALDWEHLAHLHSSSFSSVSCTEAGEWGWRARIEASEERGGQPSVIELRLERDRRRWITRTLQGRGAGNEVWTHAFELGPMDIEVVVDFFAPDAAETERERVGAAFIELYTTLYDEDEWMMRLRQRRLEDATRSIEVTRRIALGSLSDLMPTLPRCVDFNGRRLCLADVNGELQVYDTVCPHRLGPLESSPIVEGIVQCPWHGHRFDIVTGHCVSGLKLQLRPSPTLEIDRSRMVWLVDERLADQ